MTDMIDTQGLQGGASKVLPFQDVRNVFIELTSRCNMTCAFCPLPVLKRSKQDMPHEWVLKILNECAGQGRDVTFHVLGEPLLSPHFFEYAQLCDDLGITYWLVTNGLCLDNARLRKLFALKRLHNVEISFHTMTEETFTLRGCSANFAAWMEKVRNAVFSPERLASNIQINIDVMYDSHLQSGGWSAFTQKRWQEFATTMRGWAAQLEVAHPECRHLWPRYYEGRKKIFHRGVYYHYRRFTDIPETLFASLPPFISWIRWEIFPNTFVSLKKFFFFTKNPAYLRHSLGREMTVIPASSNVTCTWPCDLAILSNGKITFCCLDYEGELACGNIADMTLAEAALSSRRRLVMSRPGAFSLCRLCKGELQEKN